MSENEFRRIKNKILSLEPTRYWGDDFDVRFYLISKLKKLQNKFILDVGGGIGIICSELDKSNFRINLDSSFYDLMISKKLDSDIQNICASMTDLPFKNDSIDVVICSHVLEIAKHMDIEKKQAITDDQVATYPTIEKILNEIRCVLHLDSIFFLTTPNNRYYQSTKPSYHELKKALGNHFSKYSLLFYNTFPRLSKTHRKLNLANVMPKLISKAVSRDKLVNSLLREDESVDRESVSFYVEAFKD